MINILVRLEVKDFDSFEEFEMKASMIMKKYHGNIISAFETIRNPDGTGEEIHVLEFPSEEYFINYRKDDSLANLSGLRNQAISNTEVKMSINVKAYA